MILLIDNYDSFAHNLARYFRQLGQAVTIVRNDQFSLEDVERYAPSAIVMSPGPCTPQEAGRCLSVVDRYLNSIPILGICLGHQVICEALGGRICRVPPVHGRDCLLSHNGNLLFDKIDNPFLAGRYHSLIAERNTLPACLQVISETSDDIVMAVQHRQYPVVGVQFHPESILTPCGYRLLANFLGIAGISCAESRVVELTAALMMQRPASPVKKSSASPPATTPISW